MKKPKVIFLCTHNAARSQIAEAFLRNIAGNHFEVYSAGFEPNEIHPLTYKVMEELGYELKDHTAKALDTYLGKVHFGIVITVCTNAEKLCPVLPGVSTREYWPFDDPSSFEGTEEEKLEKFREVRDQIKEKILDFLKRRNIQSE